MIQTKKRCAANDIVISKCREIQSIYPQHTLIFTDGSKQNTHSTTAVVVSLQTDIKRLPNSSSVYVADCAELYAILLSLHEIVSNNMNVAYF